LSEQLSACVGALRKTRTAKQITADRQYLKPPIKRTVELEEHFDDVYTDGAA
jgi:hypothetical protein